MCNLSVRTVVKLCTVWRFPLGVRLNCDDICMCIVNKQFELLEFIFDSIYVDLQYDEISLTLTAGSVFLCGDCSHVVVFGLSMRLSWYLVPYVEAMVAMTVMRVLLLVLHVCMPRECEGDGNAGVGAREWVYGWYTLFRCCFYCQRCAKDEWVRGVRGVGDVCDMCLGWDGRCGE